MATDINDLPATSPHGSYSKHDARNLGFATDPNETRGTATARRDTCCNSQATAWRKVALPIALCDNALEVVLAAETEKMLAILLDMIVSCSLFSVIGLRAIRR